MSPFRSSFSRTAVPGPRGDSTPCATQRVSRVGAPTPRRAWLPTFVFAALIVTVVVLVGYGVGHRPTRVVALYPAPPLSRPQAEALLATVPNANQDFGVAYARTAFGPAWADVDHNGCDTRNDILGRDLTGLQFRPRTRQCVVIAGVLRDPYTGSTIAFTKSDATKVQIDHLVPLHAAWTLGAYRWTPEKRLAYANDPQVLVAASGAANQDKSDKLADQWRPSNRAAWCHYAGQTIVVHVAYELPVTPSERRALRAMLKRCPRQ